MKRFARGFAMVALAAAFALTVVACSPQETGPSPARRDPGVKGVRLYVFDCGTLQVDPARFRLAKEEVATTNASVPCFLVAHPKGRLMWDPGAVPDADWRPSGAETTHRLVLPDGSQRDVRFRKPLIAQGHHHNNRLVHVRCPEGGRAGRSPSD
jgi:hypothetical protein